MKYGNRIIRGIPILLMALSLFGCATVDLSNLPSIPSKSGMKAKTNLNLKVDSIEFRGMAKSARGAAFKAEPVMLRYIHNKNFFKNILASDEKQMSDKGLSLRIKVVATPRESHKFNWLITWPAIYPITLFWPVQHKKGKVGVHIKCEVLNRTGDPIALIETDHSEAYEVQLYGFFSNGDAKAKLLRCYETVFASLAEKIVSNEQVVAIGRSSPKIKLADSKRKKTAFWAVKKKPRYKPVKPAQEKIIGRNINFGKYHALVIGINDYKHLPRLKTAVNDARAISKLLEKNYGFKVQRLINPNRSEIIYSLSKLRRTMTRNDNLLIYYAGHGWLDKQAQEGYWLPVDASQENEANWVSNSTITANIRALTAKHIMVIADSCYSGKLTRGIHIKHKTPDYLTRMSGKTTRVVLASGGLEPVEDSGGRDNHSVFAAALLSTLKSNKSVIDGTELFSKIKRPVMVNTDQTPEYGDIRKTGHDGGDFLFVFSP